MRYRALDATGDYTFGRGQANFLVNSPACVAQLVQTRLGLGEGEWFVDTSDGTPWNQSVLGTGTSALYDLAIQQRILNTPGVVAITNYSSSRNPTTRALAVTCTLTTIYGQTSFTAVI